MSSLSNSDRFTPPSRTDVILYSINYSGGLLKELPYIAYFVERSLCHLSTLNQKGTRIILITPTPVAQYILNYHFKELYQMDEELERSAYERLILLCPQSQRALPLGDLVMEDVELINTLIEEKEKVDEIQLISFAPSQKIDDLGEKLKAQVQECPEFLSYYWGSKAGSKEIFIKSNVPTPNGTTNIFKSLDGIKEELFRLAQSLPQAQFFVIKLNDSRWGAGLGNAVINREKFLQTSDFSQSIDSSVQSWENLEQEILQGGAIVEEYVKGAICSPSSQGFIDASGGVKILSSHDQILVGSQYIGCVFPAPVQYISQMNESIKKVGKQLHLHGVHGTFGIDFIGFENGKLLATEINLRKVGPTHAFSYVESAIGNTIDSDGFLRNKKGQPIYYVHRRLYEPSILKYLEPKTAVEALRSCDLLYKDTTQTGTILHILGALKPCGYVEITSIENSRDKAFELDKQAQKALLAKAKLLMRE